MMNTKKKILTKQNINNITIKIVPYPTADHERFKHDENFRPLALEEPIQIKRDTRQRAILTPYLRN